MIRIIHLSDFHYRENWEENQGVVLRSLFIDIERQIALSPKDTYYLVMSGDFVLAGDRNSLFQEVLDLFDKELNRLNIPKSNRFCVPGNHDIQRTFVEDKFVDH